MQDRKEKHIHTRLHFKHVLTIGLFLVISEFQRVNVNQTPSKSVQ
jgi:hypothetical protein